MYDFTYRSASAPTLGVFAPLKIEGAPDHGTIADARVWAEYYDVRISLYDGRGRWLCDAHPDGKVMGVAQRLLDMLDRAEAADHTSRVVEKMRAAGITREDAVQFRAKWLERYPEMRAYFATVQHPAMQARVERKMQEELDTAEACKRAWALGLDWQAEVDGVKETGESVAARVGRLWDIANTRPSWSHVRALVKCAEFGRPRFMRALGAMSGKTAFLDDRKTAFLVDRIGLHRLQADMRVLRVGRPHPRPTSLSYNTIASLRGQTCSDQFEEKTTPPARARHLSGVSVDLLVAVSQIGGA